MSTQPSNANANLCLGGLSTDDYLYLHYLSSMTDLDPESADSAHIIELIHDNLDELYVNALGAKVAFQINQSSMLTMRFHRMQRYRENTPSRLLPFPPMLGRRPKITRLVAGNPGTNTPGLEDGEIFETVVPEFIPKRGPLAIGSYPKFVHDAIQQDFQSVPEGDVYEELRSRRLALDITTGW